MARGKDTRNHPNRRVDSRYSARLIEDNTPSYDSALGPRDMTRRPLANEWDQDDVPLPTDEEK